MEISIKQEQGVAIVGLKGRLDAVGAMDLERRMAVIGESPGPVVMDMQGVEYISSIGVGLLMKAEKRCGIVLVGLTPFAARILELAGLLSLRRAGTVAEGVEAARRSQLIMAWRQVGARRYLVRQVPGVSGALDKWGEGEATLEELGFCFGIGGFGNTREQATPAMGLMVAGGTFAGVLLPEGVADFLLTERPAETVVFLEKATGFTGRPSLVVEAEAGQQVGLEELARDVLELTAGPRLLGLVVWTEGSLIVALVEDGRLEAHGFVLSERAKEQDLQPSVRLDQLRGLEQVKPERRLDGVLACVYLPGTIRAGEEKRLKIELAGAESLREEWERITRRLYRDCTRVILDPLHGGYMATTFRVTSYDSEGRRLLPTVLKISTLELIRREEEAHRRYVERFILNNSTTILGTAVEGEWAALRYNFLGISGGEGRLSWLRHLYIERPQEQVLPLFERLYTWILKPWYGQPRWEPLCLYADHTPLRLFPKVCEEAERLFGFSAELETIDCPELGRRLANPFRFLKYEYPRRQEQVRLWYQGITHGDLNLQNVLVDERENLYVIDFSETRPRNIVSDFARMEPIVKFETTRLESEQDLERLLEFEEGLAAVSSLNETPENRYRGDDPMVAKAHAVICRLRKYAKMATLFETEMTPYWLAVLEWTYSVVCYALPAIRKKYAAYSAAIICERVMREAA